MTWEKRLKKASIVTPDGREYSFLYEDVSREFANKTSRYLFSEKNGAFVRNFGIGALDIPIKIIFNGPDYDLISKRFDVSTAKPGASTLNHPIYGTKTVVIESVKRQDNLRSGSNEASFELNLVETIELDKIFTSGFSSIFSKIVDFVENAGQILDDAVYNLTNNSIFNFAKSRWNAAVDIYTKVFDKILDTGDTLKQEFNTIKSGFKSDIDSIIIQPQQLGSMITTLIRIPAASKDLAQTKNLVYLTAIEELKVSVTGIDLNSKNKRLELQVNITGLLVGLCESNLLASEDGKSFVTRTDAINAAVELIDTYNDVQDFLDNEQLESEAASLENRFIVSDLNTQSLSDIVKITAGNLIELSFSLKQERIIELQKERNFIELCFELYETTDNDTLDFFIKTNNLEGDEFIIIPKFREIKYYI